MLQNLPIMLCCNSLKICSAVYLLCSILPSNKAREEPFQLYCGEFKLFIATVALNYHSKRKPLSQLLATQDAEALLCRCRCLLCDFATHYEISHTLCSILCLHNRCMPNIHSLSLIRNLIITHFQLLHVNILKQQQQIINDDVIMTSPFQHPPLLSCSWRRSQSKPSAAGTLQSP